MDASTEALSPTAVVGKVTVTVVDPLAQLAAAHSIKRPAKGKPPSDNVKGDVDTLLQAGAWHAVLGRTAMELSKAPASPTTLQMWHARIAALWKLRKFAEVETELATLGSLDSPKYMLESYSEQFAGEKGSMVPFALRVIVAELPAHRGNPTEALDRLFALARRCKAVIARLLKGQDEAGGMPGPDDAAPALALWRSRTRKLNYVVGNCLLQSKHYGLALATFAKILKAEPENAELCAAIGRIALELGDIELAEGYFTQAAAMPASDAESKAICQGLLQIARGDVTEAAATFAKAGGDDANARTAGNNEAVSLLYAGSLEKATARLHAVTTAMAEVDVSLVFNLSTLFELQSSTAQKNKTSLVPKVVEMATDDFSIESLKLQAPA